MCCQFFYRRADRGHQDRICFAQAKSGLVHCKGRKNIIDRHQNYNHRVKSFDSLSGTFRHDVLKHHILHTVATIVQIDIETGDRTTSLAE